MTKGGRIFGGIFSIIGSGITLLVAWVFWIIAWATPGYDYNGFIITLIVGAVGLVGGILLITDKTAGGILVVIAATGAVVAIIIWVLPVLFAIPMPPPVYALITVLWFIPPIMLIVGGIVGLTTGSD